MQCPDCGAALEIEDSNNDVTLACVECWWMVGASKDLLDALSVVE